MECNPIFLFLPSPHPRAITLRKDSKLHKEEERNLIYSYLCYLQVFDVVVQRRICYFGYQYCQSMLWKRKGLEKKGGSTSYRINSHTTISRKTEMCWNGCRERNKELGQIILLTEWRSQKTPLELQAGFILWTQINKYMSQITARLQNYKLNIHRRIC